MCWLIPQMVTMVSAEASHNQAPRASCESPKLSAIFLCFCQAISRGLNLKGSRQHMNWHYMGWYHHRWCFDLLNHNVGLQSFVNFNFHSSLNKVVKYCPFPLHPSRTWIIPVSWDLHIAYSSPYISHLVTSMVFRSTVRYYRVCIQVNHILFYNNLQNSRIAILTNWVCQRKAIKIFFLS